MGFESPNKRMHKIATKLVNKTTVLRGSNAGSDSCSVLSKYSQ